MQISAISMFKAQNAAVANKGMQQPAQCRQTAADTFCKSANMIAFKGNDNIDLHNEITRLTRKEARKQGYTCVSTAKELQKALNQDKKVCLMKDIKLDPNLENNWKPIKDFSGELNGNGFTITGLRINQPDSDEVGLFSMLSNDAKVENLILTDAKITGQDYVGGLAGAMWDDTSAINNKIEADVEGQDYVGGLTGYMTDDATAAKNTIEADVKGQEWVGGLTGWMSGNAKAKNNNIEADVEGENYVGGLAGWICDYATAEYNNIEADVKGQDCVGGLAGWMSDNATALNNNTDKVKVIIEGE